MDIPAILRRQKDSMLIFWHGRKSYGAWRCPLFDLFANHLTVRINSDTNRCDVKGFWWDNELWRLLELAGVPYRLTQSRCLVVLFWPERNNSAQLAAMVLFVVDRWQKIQCLHCNKATVQKHENLSRPILPERKSLRPLRRKCHWGLWIHLKFLLGKRKRVSSSEQPLDVLIDHHGQV